MIPHGVDRGLDTDEMLGRRNDASRMPIRPSVLVFDVNETLIDIDSIAPLFGSCSAIRRVLREWFGQLVMYSMTATLSERYVDFFTLGQGVLRMLADIYRVDITDDDVLASEGRDAHDAGAPRHRRRA